MALPSPMRGARRKAGSLCPPERRLDAVEGLAEDLALAAAHHRRAEPRHAAQLLLGAEADLGAPLAICLQPDLDDRAAQVTLEGGSGELLLPDIALALDGAEAAVVGSDPAPLGRLQHLGPRVARAQRRSQQRFQQVGLTVGGGAEDAQVAGADADA